MSSMFMDKDIVRHGPIDKGPILAIILRAKGDAMKTLYSATAALALLVAVTSAGSAAGSSTLTFMFKNVNIHGAKSTVVTGINNAGVMVGNYTDQSGVSHGFRLSNGKATIIDDPASTVTRPSGINKAGVIVGYYSKSGRLQAFEYNQGKFTDIGPAGASASGAFGINDQQEITGEFFDSSGAEHGFLLKAGRYTTLDVPGATFTQAYGINDSSTITMIWGDSAGQVESSIYRNSKYTSINVPGATSSYAHSINRAGDVIFTWLDSSHNFHGALLHSGKYYDFEDPHGNSAGNGINDHHMIVGAYLISKQEFGGYQASY
ncbi:MAG TPA: hypothetical protein VGP35_02005 [Terriglobales bacterium]|jgi:probable HAF family extracellular repeat protein|nr:hypothetical protein [Terriglobales bacterium]